MDNITGYINQIIFKKKEDAFAILSLITDDQEELVCVGTFPGVTEGQNLEISGEYINHPVYGREFKASSFKEITPKDEQGIIRYLASGAIKGVGETLAARIVKKFGAQTFDIMEREPERLAEVKGISLRIAQEIAVQVIEKKSMRDAFIFLEQYGISNNLAVKIYEKYGEGLYSVIRENPYKLAEDISGVGFKTSDEIAQKLNIGVDSQFRIRCAVLYVLSEASAESHTYLPKEILLGRLENLLGITKEKIVPEFTNLEVEKKIVIVSDKIYSSVFYYTELGIARKLSDLNISMDDELLKKEEKRIRSSLDRIFREQNVTLDSLQEEAVFETIRNGITIISGGPGTGKTTTINTIIRFFEDEGLDILLAAPTGRAAKRMQEATGYEAKTIHRLLEVNGGSSDEESRLIFDRNESNPLEADVIILDEMSMIDVVLFNSLLKAVDVGTRLVFVGDVDQLPSVGPGQVLKDLINSEAFHVVKLEKIFRQKDESDIVTNAHLINDGKHILMDNKSAEFFFLERDNIQVIYKHMVQLIKEKLPSYVDADPMDIQVLTPMRRGELGVEALNRILQEQLNPPSKNKKQHLQGERLFREGDKVMQIKNNYQTEWEIHGFHGVLIDNGKGVFNGDTGVIEDIDETSGSLKVIFDENKEVLYPFGNLDEIELAYAVTIHKSQGSEYPAVILPLLSGPKMLFSRNLLYTAITRARKCVTILGRRETVYGMIDNKNENDRFCSLYERIREVMGIEDN